jgi:lipopolysaccharide transport system permease protein
MRLTNPFTTLYRHRDLVAQFTKRELQLRHKGSRLGHLWALLSPLTMLVLYLFVFGFILGGKFGVLPHESTMDYALALFLSLSLFQIIAVTIGVAPLLIASQPNYVKKVVFPAGDHPAGDGGVVALPRAAQPAAFAALDTVQSRGPVVADPGAALAVAAAGADRPGPGVGAGRAGGVHPRYQPGDGLSFDRHHVFQRRLLLAGQIDGPLAHIWAFLKYNPLLWIFEEARKIVLWHTPLDYGALGYVYLCAFVTVALGYTLFSILRPYFAEVI